MLELGGQTLGRLQIHAKLIGVEFELRTSVADLFSLVLIPSVFLRSLYLSAREDLPRVLAVLLSGQLRGHSSPSLLKVSGRASPERAALYKSATGPNRCAPSP